MRRSVVGKEIRYIKYGTWFYPRLVRGIGMGSPERLPIGTPVLVVGGKSGKPLVVTERLGREWWAYVPKISLRRRNPMHGSTR
jgi:hypothetical protein